MLVLPVGGSRRGQLTGRGLTRLQENMRGVECIVMDGFSMLGQKGWAYLHRLLEQARSRKAVRGSK